MHAFLFTDLVGFTSLTEERGDEHGAEVAHAFYDCVRSLLPSHGAVEVKTLGDGMMLRAGDPDAAVRLALAIVTSAERRGAMPPVRVGIHAGPAVERNGDWYGTTVNVAARLCAAAGGGEVLISESTCEAVARMPSVRVSDRRLHWLKNLTQPVPARAIVAQPARRLRPRLSLPCPRSHHRGDGFTLPRMGAA